ncbi:MAG TPA: lysoplasmalogenase [Myxococcota bacterium]|jgi:uncharacterized membrane protein YhhN
MAWQAQALLLSAGALVAGLALTWGEYRGPRALIYAAKPLATLLILALAALAPAGTDPQVARWIVAGLVFSLAGDVLLMLPSDRFAAGLASFLIAHLCYIAAFTSEAGVQLAPLWLAPLLVAVWLVYRRLAPGLGELRIPVIVYIGVIVVMAWQALARCAVVPGAGPPLAAAGALLFATSDSALALARFQGPFPGSQALVYASYFAAQWLIALSLYATPG